VPDARKSFYPGQTLNEKTRTVMSRIEHDLNDRTMVYAGAGYTYNTYKQNLATSNPGGIDSLGNMTVANAWYDQNQESSAADAGLRTRFETGSVKHTLVLGFNYLEQKTQYFYTQSAGVPSNIYNPVPLPDITAFRNDPQKSGEIRQYSTAIADTLSLLDDKLMLTLGLRKQTLAQESFTVGGVNNGLRTGNYKSDAVTPLLGIVVKPVSNVSLYANHTSGLTRGAVAGAARSNAGETFPPQKSKQTEVGVKVDWGQMTTQAALYQIERPSSYTDVVTNALVYGGEQRNRGLELTAYGELQRGLRLMASAAFQDAVYTRTGGASAAFQGNDARGVPDRNYNLGLDWDTPWVPGLSLNGRVIYTSSVYANEANTQKVDDWSRLDIGARYKTKMNGTPVTFRANLENVTDEQYWVVSNYVTVGAPRTLMVSAAVDF
jgi:iron complex outermembrane receptor protein